MAIGKLTPRQGWRVFTGEVGVIVLGVLIALGAQQAVDEWRWRQEVTRTKADLDSEILSSAAIGAERVAVNRCLVGRLTELGRKIAASDGGWTGNPFRAGGERAEQRIESALPIVYRAPNRVFTTDAWEQAKANGILNHMKPDEVAVYSGIYQQIGDLRSLNNEEWRAIPALSYLAFDGKLEAASRERALSTVAMLDAYNGFIVLVSRQIALAAAELDGKLSDALIKGSRDAFQTQLKLRGRCVDVAAGWARLRPLMAKGDDRVGAHD